MKKKAIILILLLVTSISYASVVVFLYHRFNDARYPTTNTWTDELEMHIRLVKELGFEVWTLKDLEDYAYGRRKFDGKAVVFTVDDGYRSVYEHAYPVFKKHNIPFSVFLQVGAVGYPDYLSWDMVKEMLANNVEFANHSFSHEDFPSLLKKMSLDQLIIRFREDLKKANQVFYERTGYWMKYYAYPYGHYLPEFFEVLKQEGFSLAFTQNPGPYSITYGLYEIPREPLLEDWATESHVKYILSRKPLILNVEKLIVEGGLLQFSGKLTEPSKIRNVIAYISEKGVVPLVFKDMSVQFGPISLTKAYNRIFVSARDQNNVEYIRYWLAYNLHGK